MGESAIALRKLYRLMNQGKNEEALKMYDEKVVFEVPGSVLGGTFTGTRELGDFFRKVNSVFRNSLVFRVDRIVEAGNTVLVERTATAKMASGQETQWRAADVYEFRRGKVAKVRVYTDTEAIGRATGKL